MRFVTDVKVFQTKSEATAYLSKVRGVNSKQIIEVHFAPDDDPLKAGVYTWDQKRTGYAIRCGAGILREDGVVR